MRFYGKRYCFQFISFINLTYLMSNATYSDYFLKSSPNDTYHFFICGIRINAPAHFIYRRATKMTTQHSTQNWVTLSGTLAYLSYVIYISHSNQLNQIRLTNPMPQLIWYIKDIYVVEIWHPLCMISKSFSVVWIYEYDYKNFLATSLQ